ncbi:thiamine-phosphate kinase [Skermania piniformis]|uniref:thiamine-phosphate kinase n=1 Tax=Skermania pinensis TaxID=39122 RepID=UPI000B10BCFE|nr:thiamine-phosphate kinase [Skermania piniformis]
MAPRTVAELGEAGVIALINSDRSQPATTLLGPGDDAAVLAAPDGRVVVTTDMLVQGRHFRLDWSDPADVGAKAIAQNAADVVAMGARPTGFVVALGCPGDTPLATVEALAAGMWAEAARAGGGIVGGDLVQSPMMVLSVAAFGDLDGRDPVRLTGARPGDILGYAGRFGWSAAGLALLEAERTEPAEPIAVHRRPAPPYRAGVAAGRAGATAMTDVSDGLIADLAQLAAASGVRIDLAAARVVDPALTGIAAELGADPRVWTLTGGEDHALVATFDPRSDIPAGWRTAGTVGPGSGVWVDGVRWSGAGGWESFTR